MKFLLPFLFILFGCQNKSISLQENFTEEDLKICVLGDTGKNSLVQKKVAHALSVEKCHTVHFLGDLVYPDGLTDASDARFESHFNHYYQDLHKIYLVMGNHDYRGSVSAWKEISKKRKNIHFPSEYYLLRMNGLCLVHLDTNFYKLPLHFGKGLFQWLWLNRIEEVSDSCQVKVALTHHPFESRGHHHGPSSGLARLFLWSEVIGTYDYLVSGHEHILSDEGVREGTRLLISGAGGIPDKGEKAGFLILHWNQSKNKMNYEFRNVSTE